MTRARDIANLVDANGDIVAGALDNVPPADLVNDTTPQLGGSLDLNSQSITGSGNFQIAGSDNKISAVNNHLILHDTAETDTGSNYWYIYRNGGNGELRFYRNGATRWTISGDGVVTTPYQPSFHAYPSSGSTTLSGNSTWGTLAFDATGWNIGSHYNTSNSRFTAPVTGLYQFNWGLQLENANSITWAYMYPVINGVRSTNVSKGPQFMDFRTDTNYHTENATWLLKLTAGDYVTMDYIISGNDKILKGESNFQGYLIG